MEGLAKEHIDQARQLSENGNYSKAIDLFITAFDICPRIKAMYEPEFRALLLKLNELLGDSNMEVIFTNFGRAMNTFPNNMYLLNDIGKYLYKFGFYSEAWSHFQKALILDAGFVSAEKNLNSMKNLLVERWHFRMLNDKIRNDAYFNAIREVLIPYKDSILDVGTGTGILAMYANEFKPKTITGVDGSATMTQIANDVTKENDCLNIIIKNSMSTELMYKEIGGKCSLLVTEMFDAGLFGEHILQTLSHAWRYLIAEDGRVIPNKAEFFVIGAECDSLNKKYQLSSSIKTTLNIPSLNVHIITGDETYDCEDVHLYKDIKYLTEPHSLVEVDFNSYNDMQEKLNKVEPYDVDFKVKDSGQINTVIGWFNLYINNNVTITTDPRSKKRANAWQQAVFFDYVPKEVEANDIVNVKFLINGGKLTLVPDNNIFIWRISPETIRFLNDTEYLKKIKGCIGMASVYLGQITDMSNVSMVDLCPYPIFGLQMLKRGAKSLTCCAKNQHDLAFLEMVFMANDIPLSCVTILDGEDWSKDVFHNEYFHAIFVHMFDICGEIDLRLRDIGHRLKRLHLHHGGLFMPANIKLVGQIISSHWLDINNRVDDVNIGKFKVAMHVNKYQVSQNFCIDFSLLEYTPISDHIELGICSNRMRSDVFNAPIIRDGSANAILCWYNIELLEDLEEISTNRNMSFMDGTVFLANPNLPVVCGKMANVLCCVDPDGSFKLVVDVETLGDLE